MSCSGHLCLGPTKMNLCLNVQNVQLWPSWYLAQCSVRSQQRAAIWKIKTMKILLFFLNSDRLFNICFHFFFNVYFKCWTVTGTFSFQTLVQTNPSFHHILLQLWINLEGLEHLFSKNVGVWYLLVIKLKLPQIIVLFSVIFSSCL